MKHNKRSSTGRELKMEGWPMEKKMTRENKKYKPGPLLSSVCPSISSIPSLMAYSSSKVPKPKLSEKKLTEKKRVKD